MRKVISLIFLLIMLSEYVYCQDIPKFGGVLRIGIKSEITTYYPWEVRDMETLMAMGNVYEPLIRLKKEVADTEPCLAVEWGPSKDFKKWIFKLRRNVQFHDGTIFNADSVIRTLSISKILNAEMKKIDNYTVEFNLVKPNAAFAISLSIEYFGIASRTTVECFQNKCKDFIAKGTGPFMVEKWEPGKEIILVANTNYWGGRPYLDKVIFNVYKSSEDALQALINKKIDILLGLSPDDIKEVKKYKYLVFQSKPALSVGFIGMNSERAPFNNKLVRKAISYAINKKEIVNKFFYLGQTGSVANSWLPPAMFGYDKDVPKVAYDLNEARKLLLQAGYPNGFETTIIPPPVARVTMHQPEEISNDIASQLAKIGIKAKVIKASTWKEFLDKAFSGKFDMLLFGWVADTVDPNDFLSALFTKSAINFTNISRWYNPEFEEILEQARYASIKARMELYRKAQMMLYEEMPVIPFVSAMQLGAWDEKVKGYVLHPASRLYLEYIWLSE